MNEWVCGIVVWGGRGLFLVYPYTEDVASYSPHLDFSSIPISHEAIIIEILAHPVWQIPTKRKLISVFSLLSGVLPMSSF